MILLHTKIILSLPARKIFPCERELLKWKVICKALSNRGFGESRRAQVKVRGRMVLSDMGFFSYALPVV